MVKMIDVARHAGTSVATVSRVLNNNDRVDPELVRRVMASAAELGYTPNPLARNLRPQRTTHSVGTIRASNQLTRESLNWKFENSRGSEKCPADPSLQRQTMTPGWRHIGRPRSKESICRCFPCPVDH